jgi:hypothetical protein
MILTKALYHRNLLPHESLKNDESLIDRRSNPAADFHNHCLLITIVTDLLIVPDAIARDAHKLKFATSTETIARSTETALVYAFFAAIPMGQFARTENCTTGAS